MLVGEPLGGKSTVLQTLAQTLGNLHDQQLNDEATEDQQPPAQQEFQKDKYCKVIQKILNPKSITLGQLYGQFDALSHEVELET